MNLKELKVGDIITCKSAMTGYEMVMAITDKYITTSQLFWTEGIVYNRYRLKNCHFLTDYKLHDPTKLGALVSARYDHEKMRRINKINEQNIKTSNVHGNSSSRRKTLNLFQRKRRGYNCKTE